MASERRDGGREDFWRSVLRRFVASDWSVRAFCRRERLSEPSFYAWRRTLRERDAVARRTLRGQSAPRPAFLPAAILSPTILPAAILSPAIRATSMPDGVIVIELLGGRSLKLPESMAAARVAALVHAIEGASGATEVRP